MALFGWRHALNKVAATLRSGPVVAQVPGQVAVAPRTASAEEAQESAAALEELSENYDEESAAALDGEEVAAAALEDEGAGPPAAGV